MSYLRDTPLEPAPGDEPHNAAELHATLRGACRMLGLTEEGGGGGAEGGGAEEGGGEASVAGGPSGASGSGLGVGAAMQARARAGLVWEHGSKHASFMMDHHACVLGLHPHLEATIAGFFLPPPPPCPEMASRSGSRGLCRVMPPPAFAGPNCGLSVRVKGRTKYPGSSFERRLPSPPLPPPLFILQAASQRGVRDAAAVSALATLKAAELGNVKRFLNRILALPW